MLLFAGSGGPESAVYRQAHAGELDRDNGAHGPLGGLRVSSVRKGGESHQGVRASDGKQFTVKLIFKKKDCAKSY